MKPKSIYAYSGLSSSSNGLKPFNPEVSDATFEPLIIS